MKEYFNTETGEIWTLAEIEKSYADFKYEISESPMEFDDYLDKLLREGSLSELAMNTDKVEEEVKAIRKRAGSKDACTDPDYKNGIARFVVEPGSAQGYVQEYDLVEGKERHRGFGTGCFWTDWE